MAIVDVSACAAGVELKLMMMRTLFWKSVCVRFFIVLFSLLLSVALYVESIWSHISFMICYSTMMNGVQCPVRQQYMKGQVRDRSK